MDGSLDDPRNASDAQLQGMRIICEKGLEHYTKKLDDIWEEIEKRGGKREPSRTREGS